MNTKLIFSFFILTLLISCAEEKKEKPTENQKLPGVKPTVENLKELPDESPVFRAQGNEPFWNLHLYGDRMLFTSLIEGYDSIITPLPNVIRAADANIKRYRAQTEKVQLDVTINQKPCEDTMADRSYNYTVTVRIGLTGDENFHDLKGCGNYNTDERLHDIWVLETLGTDQPADDYFARELPNLEINANENSFVGFTGCNRMRGTIFSEGKLLRFTNITTTRMACPFTEGENELLQRLRKATSYEISNNRLRLFNPDSTLLTFKKVD
ncbi:META domain-containing protein [Robertkochia aurantiaca]|uniref:META domain-containing protein n=1 Tax=Robertkochia aurantiaca TaxID=2873700 RepID=UPI001CCF0F0B|nr:META domain-containing protein [Robertkochia sp. 3YJGBD-33]